MTACLWKIFTTKILTRAAAVAKNGTSLSESLSDISIMFATVCDSSAVCEYMVVSCEYGQKSTHFEHVLLTFEDASSKSRRIAVSALIPSLTVVRVTSVGVSMTSVGVSVSSAGASMSFVGVTTTSATRAGRRDGVGR